MRLDLLHSSCLELTFKEKLNRWDFKDLNQRKKQVLVASVHPEAAVEALVEEVLPEEEEVQEEVVHLVVVASEEEAVVATTDECVMIRKQL